MRKPNNKRGRMIRRSTVETPAGIISIGTAIKVAPRDLGEADGDLVECRVLEIWPSGRIRTDRGINGTPFGTMPI